MKSTKEHYVIHPADSGGCGFHRIRVPTRIFTLNTEIPVIDSGYFLTPEQLEHYEVKKIITQRQTMPAQVECLKTYRRVRPGMPIQMDLDDMLWQVPGSNPYHRTFKGENRKSIFENIRSVDIMTTSTEPLRVEIEKIRRGSVEVYPNCIPHMYFKDFKPRAGEKLRVGWAGSATHEGDLNKIKSVVLNTLDEFDWVFMGYQPNWAKGLVSYVPGVDVNEYLSKLPALGLDVAIAPLEVNLFNECKSNLKLLEFSAISIPVVTTDIYPYQENPGFKIVSGKKEEKKWLEALRAYEDESLRETHARNSYEWAHNFKLENRYNDIEDLWLR